MFTIAVTTACLSLSPLDVPPFGPVTPIASASTSNCFRVFRRNTLLYRARSPSGGISSSAHFAANTEESAVGVADVDNGVILRASIVDGADAALAIDAVVAYVVLSSCRRLALTPTMGPRPGRTGAPSVVSTITLYDGAAVASVGGALPCLGRVESAIVVLVQQLIGTKVRSSHGGRLLDMKTTIGGGAIVV